jgi:hypothetical protein
MDGRDGRGKALEDDAPERIFILYAAEAIANFMEHLALQQRSMSRQQWTVWDRFIRSSYENSRVLQDILDEHRDWYADELLAIVDRCPRRHAKRID